MSKKILSIALMFVLLLSAFAVAESGEKVIALGTSGLVMTVAASYEKGEITDEDAEEGLVAYYKSDDYDVDFDIYQWAVADGETLAEAAAEDAEEYNGGECVETEFAGIPAFYYEAEEECDDGVYVTTNFIMQNGDFFVELVFWMDGEDPGDYVEGMVDSIVVAGDGKIAEEGKVITLGSSTLKIALPYVFTQGELTEEEVCRSSGASLRSSPVA